ncbi:MAG: NAD-dependent DNA ligase LigA [Candidatus Nanohaloarchaea archaeon]|nr:NAD-dependent DNA ligase LigA [Candidatus Nanohaloarchaea archaeon]
MKEPQDNPYVHNPELAFDDPEELSQDEAEQQVELLREAISYHDHRYYVENDPVISDKAYDTLYHRLEELEDRFDLQDPNSPTQRVGGEPMDELETVEHVTEMLSLDSSEEEDEVRAFDRRVRDEVGDVRYSIEPKFDGLSVELVYEDGELDRAVTRGNGTEGEDITANVRTIRSVPLQLEDAPDELVVRGEIYMPREGFQQLNRERVQQGKDAFANPRNAAAGTVRQLDPSVVADRPLDIFCYDIMQTSAELYSQDEVFNLLERIGFPVSDHNDIVDDIDAFIDYRDRLLDRRDDLNYDIDGVVAKIDDIGTRDELGATASHPRWAYAYKFPPKTGETTVRDIVVQVGRTGKLTPVALLDPVDVQGVTISRASLHNEKQAQQLGVAPGATVTVERAGDVIPQVKEVVSEGDGTFTMPDSCPVCGSEVVGEAEHHYCTGGASCPAQLKRRLQYFASDEAMDIDGLGEQVAAQLVEQGLVEDLTDLYRLSEDDLVELPSFAEQSASKLLEGIEASKETDLTGFLTALGIRHVGRATARELAARFTLDELREASQEELEQVEDIGPQVATSITAFFAENDDLVQELLDAGVTPERRETGDELDGVTLVITGSIEGWTRDELEDLLERHGADVTSSVSGNTDYLVVGEDPGETKLSDAEEHDVEKLDPDAFRAKILDRFT